MPRRQRVPQHNVGPNNVGNLSGRDSDIPNCADLKFMSGCCGCVLNPISIYLSKGLIKSGQLLHFHSTGFYRGALYVTLNQMEFKFSIFCTPQKILFVNFPDILSMHVGIINNKRKQAGRLDNEPLGKARQAPLLQIQNFPPRQPFLYPFSKPYSKLKHFFV